MRVVSRRGAWPCYGDRSNAAICRALRTRMRPPAIAGTFQVLPSMARKPATSSWPVGVGPYQHQVAPLGQYDQVLAGGQELTVAVAAALPHQLAGDGVDAGEDRFVEPVDVAVDQHGAAELVLHPVRLPDRRRAEAVAVRGQLDERRALPVAGREEEPCVRCDKGLCDIGHDTHRPRILPQQRAVRRPQARGPRGRHHHDLPDAAQRRQHRRRVTLHVVHHVPGDVAGQAFVGGHRPAAGAAGLDDHEVVDDQGRARHRPGEVAGAGVGQDVPFPDDRAGGGVQADEPAGGAERVDPAVVPRGRRARSRTAHRLPEVGGPGVRPALGSRVEVVGRDHLLIAALLDGERAPLGDDERRVAAADGLAPERLEPGAGPVGADGGLRVDAVPLRAAEVGPVGVVLRCGRCGGIEARRVRAGDGRDAGGPRVRRGTGSRGGGHPYGRSVSGGACQSLTAGGRPCAGVLGAPVGALVDRTRRASGIRCHSVCRGVRWLSH